MDNKYRQHLQKLECSGGFRYDVDFFDTLLFNNLLWNLQYAVYVLFSVNVETKHITHIISIGILFL